MTKLSAKSSAEIEAAPARVYAILTDYRGAHRRILPPNFFRAMEVERGGTGEGTVLHVTSRILGVERTIRLVAAEPEPGRVLTESNLEMGLVTAFTVDPAPDGKCCVTIATVWNQQPGLAGMIERLVLPALFRRVYRQELALLAALCRERG